MKISCAMRTRGGWYTTKTQSFFDDITSQLRRVIVAARLRGPCPEQAAPQETRAGLTAWADYSLARRRHTINQNHENRGEREKMLISAPLTGPAPAGFVA
jgi:hypothetical protein